MTYGDEQALGVSALKNVTTHVAWPPKQSDVRAFHPRVVPQRCGTVLLASSRRTDDVCHDDTSDILKCLSAMRPCRNVF